MWPPVYFPLALLCSNQQVSRMQLHPCLLNQGCVSNRMALLDHSDRCDQNHDSLPHPHVTCVCWQRHVRTRLFALAAWKEKERQIQVIICSICIVVSQFWWLSVDSSAIYLWEVILLTRVVASICVNVLHFVYALQKK